MEKPKYIDMYKDFLTLVKKARVGTVVPEEFIRVLNLTIEEVVNTRLSTLEMSKKVYDDLSPLRKTLKSQAMTIDTNDNFTSCICTINSTSGYRRIASVSINLSATIKNVKCHLLSSAEKTEVLNGYYSKPSKYKCYYIPIVDSSLQKLRIFIPSGYTTGITSNFDIYVNPDVVLVADVTDNTKYFQFSKEMSVSVINAAARMYIEGNADPRYQSFLTEQQIKLNN